MFKYTILYKNGKTWNGKAGRIVDIPVADCVLMITTMPVAENSCVDVYSPSNAKWKHSYRAIYGKPKPKKRTPNPKSVTKKQKAFDEAYEKWAATRRPEVYIWGSGHAEYSIQAYKKWLWEQKLANSSKFTSPVSPGDIIAYWALDSNKLKCVTIKPDELIIKSVYDKGVALKDKDGFIPWNGGEMPVTKGTMVHVKLRDGKEVIGTAGYHPSSKQFKRLGDYWLYANDWSHYNEPGDIVAYKVYEENLEASEPNLDWWKDPSLGNFKVALYTSNTPTKPGYPIKSTYTFWLGANGEIVDDK